MHNKLNYPLKSHSQGAISGTCVASDLVLPQIRFPLVPLPLAYQ